MSKSEVITISILFQLSEFKTFKHFYMFYLQKHMKDVFSNTVSYNRFTELVGQNLMATSWFHGFKLHSVINDKGEILNFTITQANVDDRSPLKRNAFQLNIRKIICK